MVDGATPKPLGDLAGLFLALMVAGGIAVGWLNNRGRRHRGDGTSGDGPGSDDGPHQHGWWGSGEADGGHHGDGGDGGDGGH